MCNDTQSKQMSICVLRILATLAVVFLHTCSSIVDRTDLYVMQEQQEAFLTIGKQFMNWAVPIFLMITGTLLLRSDKQISLSVCITKYVKRIVLALFCFGIPFAMLEIYLNTRVFEAKMLLNAFVYVITGNSWAHLWYLYMLVGIYCLLPIFKRFTDAAPRNELGGILITLFIFQMIMPLIEAITGFSIAFQIPISANTIFYLLLGKYLSEKLPKPLEEKKFCVLYLVSAFVFAAFTYLYTREESTLEYFAPVFAILIFSLLHDIDIPERIRTKIWDIDRLCFGVYLIHPLFINFMYKFLKITPISFELYPLMVVLYFVFFVCCSFCASKIMSQLAPLKKFIL